MSRRVYYEMDGRMATLGAYAERYHINEQTLRNRLAHGMTIRQAILASNFLKQNETAAKLVKGNEKPEQKKQKLEKKEPVRNVRFYKTGSSSGYYDWE